MLLMLAGKEEPKCQEHVWHMLSCHLGPVIPSCYNIPGTKGDCSLSKKFGYGVCASLCFKPGSQVAATLN